MLSSLETSIRKGFWRRKETTPKSNAICKADAKTSHLRNAANHDFFGDGNILNAVAVVIFHQTFLTAVTLKAHQ
jgi:hypothetical protein